MKASIIGALILAQILSAVMANEKPSKLTFLGTNQYPISYPEVASEYQFDIEAFNLDALSNLEKEIIKDLPTDPMEAERIANERMGNLDEARAMRLFKSIALLIEWDIKKLPAFVFGEGDYVIYGVVDTATAIKRYVNSRKR